MEKYGCEVIDGYDYLVIRTTLGDKFKFLIMEDNESKSALTITYFVKPKIMTIEDDADR